MGAALSITDISADEYLALLLWRLTAHGLL